MSIRDWINSSPAAGIVVVVVLIASVAVIYMSWPGGAGGGGGDAYFYDPGTQTLFTGSGDAMPPIPAPSDSGDEASGVRAQVFACGGCPSNLSGTSVDELDEHGAFIAYLEMYTEEARAAAEREATTPEEEMAQFQAMEAGHMVRPLEGERWVRTDSRAGVEIVGGGARMQQGCPDGSRPRQCRP